MRELFKNLWVLWAKALGSKADENNNLKSDRIAFIRTMIVLQAVITNLFIVLNILKNWNK